MNINASKIAKLPGIAFMFTLLLVVYAQASLALPANGKIAFTSDRDGNSEIYLMNADGTGQTRLTNSPDREDYPTWSPDGRRIAFVRQSGGTFSINVMNADGTNRVELTTFTIFASPGYPMDDERFGMDWSPDGSKIVFLDSTDIFTINVAGGNRVNLTGGQLVNYEPTWSPDGSRIAFARSIYFHGYYPNIYVMNADGSNVRQITDCPGYCADRSPAWSPDGGRIAFTASTMDDGDYTSIVDPDGTDLRQIPYGRKPKWSPDGTKLVGVGYLFSQISVMNRDGSGITQLINASYSNLHADWQPLFSMAQISGLVLTPDGNGLRNASVTLTDIQGLARITTTSSFGFYSFDNVAPGFSYTIRILSRRFRYQSQVVVPTGDLTNVDFVGLE